MSDFEIRGADQFSRFNRALKNAGRTQMRTELNKAIKKAVKPASKRAAERLAGELPSKLKAKGSKVTLRTQVRTGKDPGVTVGVPYKRGGKSDKEPGEGGIGYSNARMLNRRGVIRHPVWGNRERWAETRVGGQGWFDDTLNDARPDVRRGIENAMQDIAEQIVRGAR